MIFNSIKRFRHLTVVIFSTETFSFLALSGGKTGP